ncbi:MAG: hypothetical protein M3R27_08880, partial [Bacteroidota bacterium]|nr:hypothetical protein [Bacteroidota bacterium]
MRIKKIIIAFFILITTQVFSQNETNNWFFGYGAGLNFSFGSALVISTGGMYNLEGTSAANDPVTGDILFYSNGLDVYDATHSFMPNGTGLLGDWSST